MIGFPAIFTENMFDKKYVAVLRFFFFCSPRCWGLLAKNKKKKRRWFVASIKPQEKGETSRTRTILAFKAPSCPEHHTQSKIIPTRLVRRRH